MTELEPAPSGSADATDRVVWDLAADAAGIGTFDLDVRTGALTWDARMREMFGGDEGCLDGTLEGMEGCLHPDDRPRVRVAVQAAIDEAAGFALEYRALLPGGGTRWFAARGRAVAEPGGRVVRVLGAAYDTTAAHEGEARVARVLESMTAAFFALDRQWRFTYVNAEAERVLGRTRRELLGGELWELFPAAVGSDFETHYRRAVERDEPVSFQAYYPAPLDAWYEIRAWPGPDGLSVYFVDVTAQRRAQERAEQAGRRAALLSRITSDLAGTLDPEEAVARLARLVVPALADWCIVTLVDDEAGGRPRLRDIGCWHADPAQRPVTREYCQLRQAALTDASFLARAFSTGRPVVVEHDASATVQEMLVPGRARELLRQLAPDAAAVLPLTARGRTVGLVTLFNGAARGAHSAEELETAREAALRAGLALDNARLYAEQRQLAEGLQRSLLTEPPQPDHLQVVVRYAPAAQTAQVGGDWYDAFLQPDGATSLVIGDVVGHDTAAAAAMGQVRGLLRGIAVTTADGPAGVLTKLDHAMQVLQVDVTATAIVARLEQTDDERARGLTRLRWSNAGHPPPLVLHPDGSVQLLVAGEPDLLLGIDPTTPRSDSVSVLEAGATVLLFTDGLVESRALTLDDGLGRLGGTVAGLSSLGLDALCDEVLALMLPESPDDDVALVAVRLHPTDRPRPPEAGPRRVPPDVPAPPGAPAPAGVPAPPAAPAPAGPQAPPVPPSRPGPPAQPGPPREAGR